MEAYQARVHGMSAPAAAGSHAGGGMLGILGGFIQELRAAGIPVSLTENLDAMEAVRHIPLEDREAFKYALAATLIKNNAHWKAFETIFEVYFSMRGRHLNIDDEEAAGDEADLERLLAELMGERAASQGGAMEAMSPEELAEMLYKALMETRRCCGRWPDRRSRATPGWSRAGRSGARTTCTEHCGSSTSIPCSSG
jgi:uncharacterized protein with von Willebrand factor type A (vWA) domain